MRVVHVTPYFIPDVYAGVEEHVYGLSSCLLERGYEVSVYTCSRLSSSVDGIEVHSFPSIRPIPSIPNPLPSPSFTLRLSKERDIIHIHGQEFLTSFIATLTAKRSRIPHVLTIHSTGRAFEERAYIRLLRRICKRTIFGYTVRSANVVVAPTTEALSVLRGYRPKAVRFIPHGISLEPFRDLDVESEYVLYVGRLVPFKGVEALIRAVPLVISEVRTDFVIVGEGPQRPYLEALTRKLHVGDHVSFRGRVEPQELLHIMSKASAFVAPGNAGYALLKAGAIGKPIVTADLGWNRSCIGDNALFIRPNDVRGLANAIVRFLTDQGLASKLSSKVRRFVELRRSWKALIERYVALYQQVAGMI